MRYASLLESATGIEMRIEHALGLLDELVSLWAVQGGIKQHDLGAGRLDPIEHLAATLVHAANEQHINGPISQRNRMLRLQIWRIEEGHDGHVINVGGVCGHVVGVVVDHSRA